MHRLRVRARSDAGFTLVEMMVASGIMFTAMVMLMTVLTSGMFATGASRQRQAATSLGNEAIEQIRALPLERLRQGLNAYEITSDSNITGSGCTSLPCFNGEHLVAYPTASATTPLNPHRQTVSVGSTTYTISSYVTWYQDIPVNDAYRITVRVAWTSLRSGPKTSEVQTILHYPAGCLSTATRPFSGPCVASFSSNASVPAGSLRVEAANGGTSGILNISFLQAQLWLPKATANLLLEQIAVAESGVRTSGVTLEATSGSPNDVSLQTATAQANNDPQTPAGIYTTVTSPTQSAGSTQVTGGQNTLALNVAPGGDTGRATATGSATTSPHSDVHPTHNCPNISGYTDKTDALPCAASAMQQSSTTSVTLRLSAGGTDLGTATLGSASAQSSRSIVQTERLRTAVGAKCPTTTGDGCVHSEATRGPQTLRVGGLPPNLTATSIPAGWAGYTVQVAGLAGTVQSAAGLGTAAPSASVTGGTVTYWSGTGYTSVNVASMAADVTLPTITINDTAQGVVVTINGTIRRPSQLVESNVRVPDCTGTCDRTSAKAQLTPPLVVLQYKVTHSASILADLAITLDPGTLRAGAAYKVAPS